MSRTSAMTKNQRKLFFLDRGMLMFYIGSIAVLGILFPVLFDNITSQLTLATFMTVTLQKQWAAESIAGERENRTLESLLGTPVQTKKLLLSKARFNMLCGSVYYLVMLVCLLAARMLLGKGAVLTLESWAVYGISALLLLLFTALYGVRCSAVAANVREAGIRPTVMCYLLSLLLTFVLAMLRLDEPLSAEAMIVVVGILLIALVAGIGYALTRLTRLTRADIIEAEKTGKVRGAGKSARRTVGLRSQAGSVFAHEMKYLATLKGLMLQFLILTVTPALLLYVGYAFLHEINLYYAILLTILAIPRIPSNLIAYSIGGEKAYKTGESVLSTPVSVSALFWGKAAVPVLVCAVMLVLSSVLNIAMANLLVQLTGDSGFMFYDTAQLVLLFGVGIGVSITMIFATSILTLKSKNPRKGLYFSTILGMVFVLPALAIVYLTELKLVGAIAYLALLLAASAVMYVKIRSVSRQTVMVALR